jgi:hypothetical protein
LINASKAQHTTIEEPPLDINGSVTPVKGRMSKEPNTFSAVCIIKIEAAPHAEMA